MEGPYVEAFVDWYLGLGFGEVVLLVSDPDRGAYAKVALRFDVRVFYVRQGPTPDLLFEEHRTAVLSDLRARGFVWLFVCDADEFLLLNKPSIGEYVAHAEGTRGHRLHMFQFVWVVMEHRHARCDDAPASHLLASRNGTMGGRVKSMTRIAELGRFRGPHQTSFLETRRARTRRIYVGGTEHQVSRPDFKRLYNYGGMQVVADSALVHLELRSLSNLMVKLITSKHPNRMVASQKRLLEAVCHPSDDSEELFMAFADSAGVKAAFSAAHALRSAADMQLHHYTRENLAEAIGRLFRISAPAKLRTATLCDGGLERKDLAKALLHHNCSVTDIEPALQMLQTEMAKTVAAFDGAPGDLWKQCRHMDDQQVPNHREIFARCRSTALGRTLASATRLRAPSRSGLRGESPPAQP